ncbi:MAG: exo-alpha-sialidase [Acidobacteria bacterium]|nr:exo-alpha-sialidase [Acidobacteriota bacterium]
MTRRDFLSAPALVPASGLHAAEPAPAVDWRNVNTGSPIPREGYSDQPCVVVTRDGNWLCVLTTGRGVEGESGQHIVSTISADQGKTWSAPVDIEPASGPEASWVMPVLAPSGRRYVFYTCNTQNLRFDDRSNNPGIGRRVGTLGQYAFKPPDDIGQGLPHGRCFIPILPMRADKENAWAAKLRIYSRPLRTSAAVGNFQAGIGG